MATVMTLRNRLSRLQKPAGPFDHLTDEEIEVRVAEIDAFIEAKYGLEALRAMREEGHVRSKQDTKGNVTEERR